MAREQEKLEVAKANSLRMAKKERKQEKARQRTKLMHSIILSVVPQQDTTRVTLTTAK